MLSKKERETILKNTLKDLEVKVFLSELDLKHLHELSITKGEAGYANVYEANKRSLEVLKGKRDYYAKLCESDS